MIKIEYIAVRFRRGDWIVYERITRDESEYAENKKVACFTNGKKARAFAKRNQAIADHVEAIATASKGLHVLRAHENKAL